LNGVYGAARAARLAGDAETARTEYARLIELCRKADGARDQVAEARAYLEGRRVTELR
jgi:hypothetical protein